MPRIVAVHGIGQQFKGPNVLHDEWYGPLCDGLLKVGFSSVASADLACAFYGDLFRPKGAKSVGLLPLDASDVDEGLEQELLNAWWLESARGEPGRVVGPNDPTKGRTPQFVQRALNALSHSRYFASAAESVEAWIVADLKQVSAYLGDKRIPPPGGGGYRRAICERVEATVGGDTAVMVGHSLGSVVAYECLCAHPEWPVRTLVTLGSPLGIRNLVFDQLEPKPNVQSLGTWPGSVERWINVADSGDIVALVKSLGPHFAAGAAGAGVDDRLVHNGADAHKVSPYLTAEETGDAIAAGLR